MNCCRPEETDTNEYRKILRTLTHEEGRVLHRNARGWRGEGGKRRATRKECKRQREEFEIVAKKRMPEDRRALPEEEGDLIREYKACMKKTSSPVG